MTDSPVRRRVLGALGALVVLGATGPAQAFLCPRMRLSPFELLDRADEVAIIDGSSGTVRVEDVWKGTGLPWLNLPAGERPDPTASPPAPPPPPQRRGARRPRRVIRLDYPSCRQDSLLEDVGSRVLAFTTSEGWAVFPFGSSVVSLPPASSSSEEQAEVLLDALRRWLVERDPTARRRLLLDLATRVDPVGADAALHFGNAPDLLHSMSRAEALELAASIEALLSDPSLDPQVSFLLLALGRLHLPESVPILLRLLRDPRFADYDRASWVRDALEQATGRALSDAFRWTSSQWMQWWAGLRAHDRRSMMTAAFAARGVADVDVTSARSLAEVMRTGAHGEDRQVALELCEQVIGRRIPEPTPSWEMSGGLGSAALESAPDLEPQRWDALARACEQGAP